MKYRTLFFAATLLFSLSGEAEVSKKLKNYVATESLTLNLPKLDLTDGNIFSIKGLPELSVFLNEDLKTYSRAELINFSAKSPLLGDLYLRLLIENLIKVIRGLFRPFF